MKKEISLIILTASLAGASMVNAQTEEEGFSANISIATDYLFRGISQTDNNPAKYPKCFVEHNIFNKYL